MSVSDYTGIVGVGEDSSKDSVFVEVRPKDAIPSIHLVTRAYTPEGRYIGNHETVIHLDNLTSEQLLGLSTSLTEASDAALSLSTKLEEEGR